MVKAKDLTIEEARSLYDELHKIFGASYQPEMIGPTGLEHLLLSRQQVVHLENPCATCELDAVAQDCWST